MSSYQAANIGSLNTGIKLGGSLATEGNVLIVVQPERLMADEMGLETITILLGEAKTPIGVHKKLLFATSPLFAKIETEILKAGGQLEFKEETPSMFKLLVEYLYTKNIPQVRAEFSSTQMASRLRDLCSLHAFAEKLSMRNEIRNRIMDAIQDGFSLYKTLPDATLVKAIYNQSMTGSKVRSFAIAALLFSVRSAYYTQDPNLSDLLGTDKTIRDDLVLEFRTYQIPDLDPRIRDCRGEEGCAECVIKKGKPIEVKSGQVKGQAKGTWPCAFHVHTSRDMSGNMIADEGCYLWNV